MFSRFRRSRFRTVESNISHVYIRKTTINQGKISTNDEWRMTNDDLRYAIVFISIVFN